MLQFREASHINFVYDKRHRDIYLYIYLDIHIFTYIFGYG